MTKVFHFSRVGGSYPLWVLHDAFAQPGRIVVQVTQMPDGRSYFWVAETIGPEGRSTGVVLDDPTSAVPIGASCKVCNRASRAQRAFPYLGGRVVVDENTGSSLPYSSADRSV